VHLAAGHVVEVSAELLWAGLVLVTLIAAVAVLLAVGWRNRRHVERLRSERDVAVQVALRTEEQALREAEALSDVLEQRVRQRTEALEALHRVALEISVLTDRQTSLELVADQARLLVDADGSVILLRDSEGLRLAAAAGSVATLVAEGVTPGVPIAERAIREERSVQGPGEPVPGMRCIECATPLRGPRGSVLGALCVGRMSDEAFDPESVDTLERFGVHAAIAVENAQLYDQVRSLSTVRERERLARELHDGLAQVIAFMSAKGEAASAHLEAGRTGEARRQLEEMRGMVEQARLDIREAILGLRAAAVITDEGLVATLESYVRRLGRTADLSVRVRDAGWRALAPEAELHLLRIVQEALTNVRKHSGRHEAEVLLDMRDGVAVLEVRDSGRGFDSAAVHEGMGLGSMRERAREAGGELELRTAPGEGTLIRVCVPVSPAEGVGGAAAAG